MTNQKEFIMWDRSESGIIPENCVGIVVDASKTNQQLFLDNAERLPKSIILLNPYWNNADYKKITDKFRELNYEIKYILDEFYSNPKQHSDRPKIVDGMKHLMINNIPLILGEIDDLPKPPFELMPNEEITYTAYQELWFKIPLFNLRIYKPFSNQLSTWNRLEEKYGARPEFYYSNVTSTASTKRESKFNFVWISLVKNRNCYKELISWAIDHNKQIALFVDQGTSKSKFLELLDKFNQS